MTTDNDHYSVNPPGSLEPASVTEHGTGADWDRALADARQRSLDSGVQHTVRHNSGRMSRIICTLDQGEIFWPRQASPVVDLQTGYLTGPELEADEPEPRRSPVLRVIKGGMSEQQYCELEAGA